MNTNTSSVTTWPTDFAYKKALKCCEQNKATTASCDTAMGSVLIIRPEVQADGTVKAQVSESVTFEDYQTRKTGLGVTMEFHQNNPLTGLEQETDYPGV